MAKKTTLTQLEKAYDSHSSSFNNLSAACNKAEKNEAINRLKRTGLTLINAIENGLTKSCAELSPMADRLIDRSTSLIDAA